MKSRGWTHSNEWNGKRKMIAAEQLMHYSTENGLYTDKNSKGVWIWYGGFWVYSYSFFWNYISCLSLNTASNQSSRSPWQKSRRELLYHIHSNTIGTLASIRLCHIWFIVRTSLTWVSAYIWVAMWGSLIPGRLRAVSLKPRRCERLRFQFYKTLKQSDQANFDWTSRWQDRMYLNYLRRTWIVKEHIILQIANDWTLEKKWVAHTVQIEMKNKLIFFFLFF